MSRVRTEASYGLRFCVLGLAAIAAASIITTNSADAGYRHRYRVLLIREAARIHRHADTESYSPLFASIVVDGNDGEVLHALNADAPRHPASLTKIMTLYLLFERLEAGRIRLDTQLKVSEHAAGQAPTKLGLRPGQTIAVDDAIKAVVTKSANDAAVTIAENLAGDEGEFARLMTQKARALGMSRTTYVNASGLPDDEQITTARDQALLGRAIQERFPHYYKYFSTPEFVYHGREMRNHNHLLGEVGGVDGIKTGYTRASGFNLVTSVHRDGRYIVAVVLGGHSAGERDARMRELISTHIREASLRHIAPPMTAMAEPPREPQAAPLAKAQTPPAQRADLALTTASTPAAPAGSNDPIQPIMVRTITYRTAAVQPSAFAPMPALAPVATPSPSRPVAPAAAPAQPAAPVAVQAVPGGPSEEEPSNIVVASTEPAHIVTSLKAEPAKPGVAMSEPPPRRAHAHGEWVVQVGAFEDEGEAKQHLSAARLKVPAMLAAADPFTERVQKGDKAYYRARFAGFDKAAAEATCKLLKRSDIECMALKN
ncbi:MAG: serine hydrolase [Xanthobacteraceae bacterium]